MIKKALTLRVSWAVFFPLYVLAVVTNSIAGENPSTPIHVLLSIDHYPSLRKPAKLTCEITSILDAPGTVAKIELPNSARLLSGDLNWEGDILAGHSVALTATIEFVEAGKIAIYCRALRKIDNENSWGDLEAIYLTVNEKEGRSGFIAEAEYAGQPEPGELLSPGSGQILDEGAARLMLPIFTEPGETPPSIEPSLGGNKNEGNPPASVLKSGVF